MVQSANGKLAWVTGAGTGIGRAVALRLAEEGFTVAISARTAENLSEVDAKAPHKLHSFPLDIKNREAVFDVHTRIEQQLGTIDLVVLCAGTYRRDFAADFNSERFAETVEVNLLGTAHCLDAALGPMLERKSGRILVTSSVVGYSGLPGAISYGATKAALINMCEAFYPDLKRNNVALSVVNPGFVDTPLTQKNDFPMPFMISDREAADHIIRGIQSRRFEIAFPWKMVFSLKLLAIMPAPIRMALKRKMLRKA